MRWKVDVRTTYFDRIEVEAPDEDTAKCLALAATGTAGVTYSEVEVDQVVPVAQEPSPPGA